MVHKLQPIQLSPELWWRGVVAAIKAATASLDPVLWVGPWQAPMQRAGMACWGQCTGLEVVSGHCQI